MDPPIVVFQDQVARVPPAALALPDHQLGVHLQTETKKVMEEYEAFRDFAKVKERLKRLADQVLLWFHAGDELPIPLPTERTPYYRALFNLTTEKDVRALLMEIQTLHTITRWLRKDLDAIVVAAMANLVFEEPTKKVLVDQLDGIKLFARCMTSPISHVRVHAARGIFSVTTVYDYKLLFAQEPGLLSLLVTCLNLDNDSLAMNAAGALANIAIHPKSKVPIVDAGALARLKDLANDNQSELVLHQVSRCLFSLAAEKVNRKIMCDTRLLDCITRLLGYVNNSDILANTIGCFGNLAMSEPVAQMSPLSERIVPIFVNSTDPTLDRQAARVLFSFCFKENIKGKLSNDACVQTIVAKIQSSTDQNVVRDLAGILASVVFNRAALKACVFERKGDAILFDAWAKFPQHEDAVCNILRAILSLSGTDGEKEAMFMAYPERIKMVCSACDRPRGLSLRKLALGALGTLSQAKRIREALQTAGALDAAVSAFFDENCPIDARKHATKVVCGLSGTGSLSFAEDSVQFGTSVAGEAARLNNDFTTWITETNQSPESRPDFALYQVDNCLSDETRILTPIKFFLFEPFILARFPMVLTNLAKYRQASISSSSGDATIAESSEDDFALPLVPQSSWLLFVEALHSRGVNGKENKKNFIEGAVLLAKALGALEVGAMLDVLDDDKVFAAVPVTDTAVTSSSSTQHTGKRLKSSSTQHAGKRLKVDGDELAVASPLLNVPDSAAVAIPSTNLITVVPPAAVATNFMPAVSATVSEWTNFENVLSSTWMSAMDCMLSQRSHTGIVLQVKLLDQGEEPLFTSSSRTRSGLKHSKFIKSMIDQWTDSHFPLGSRAVNEDPTVDAQSFPAAIVSDASRSLTPPLSKRTRRSLPKRMRCSSSVASLTAVAATSSSLVSASLPSPALQEAHEYVYLECNREILSARSSYFAGLFRGSWDDAAIKTFAFDSPVDVLVVVVRYLHYGYDDELKVELTGDPELTWKTLKTAHRYGILGLQHQCEFLLADAVGHDAELTAQLILGTQFMHVPCLWLRIYTKYMNESQNYRDVFATYPEIQEVFKENGLSQ